MYGRFVCTVTCGKHSGKCFGLARGWHFNHFTRPVRELLLHNVLTTRGLCAQPIFLQICLSRILISWKLRIIKVFTWCAVNNFFPNAELPYVCEETKGDTANLTTNTSTTWRHFQGHNKGLNLHLTVLILTTPSLSILPCLSWGLMPHPFSLSWRNSPYWAKASSLSRLHYHTHIHHTRRDSSGRVISRPQRPLPDNTQHLQETDIDVFGGIRTHNPSKRAAADRRRRPRGHWGQMTPLYLPKLLCSKKEHTHTS